MHIHPQLRQLITAACSSAANGCVARQPRSWRMSTQVVVPTNVHREAAATLMQETQSIFVCSLGDTTRPLASETVRVLPTCEHMPSMHVLRPNLEGAAPPEPQDN